MTDRPSATQRLRHAEGTLDEARRRIEQGLGVAAGALQAAEAAQQQTAIDVHSRAQALVEAGAAEVFDPWFAERWAQWRQRPTIPTELRIGSTASDLPRPLPLTVPMFGDHAVVLATSGPHAGHLAREVLRGLAVRAAAVMGPRVTLHLIDPFQEGFGFPERPHLPQARTAENNHLAELQQMIESCRGTHATDTSVRHLVLAMDFPRGYTHQAVELINRVARLSPAGVQLVVHHDYDAHTAGAAQLQLHSPVVVMVHGDGTADQAWGGLVARLDPAPPAEVVRHIGTQLQQTCSETGGGRQGPLTWGEVNDTDPATWWQQSAERELRATIGRTTSGEPLDISLGQDIAGESHAHAVIGGEAGAGKSVLLHSLITSLAARYSPDELEFYLIDGQNGVELQAYTELPHAGLVTVRTPLDLVRGVLGDVDAELSRRDALLVAAGVSDFASLRRVQSQLRLPRLVVVIDEYQRLFHQDHRDEAAGILQRITAQGRKVGIHLVLASQRFHATGLLNQDALFSNIRTRVSLRMPTDALDGIDEFDRDGRALIRQHCTAAGRVVVNDQGGAGGASQAGVVALLAADERSDVVNQLKARADGRAPHPQLIDGPQIIDGTASPSVDDNRTIRALSQLDSRDHKQLQHWALGAQADGGLGVSAWQPYDHPVALITGRSFTIHGSAAAVLHRAPQHNLLAVAHDPAILTGMLVTGIATAGLSSGPGTMTVISLTQLPGPGDWDGALGGHLSDLLAGRAQQVSVPTQQPHHALEAAIAELGRRSALSPDELAGLGPVLVVATGLDRHRDFLLVDGRYAPEASPATRTLMKLATDGPMLGVHVLLGFTSRALWARVMPAKSQRHFAHRLLQQLSEEDSRELADSSFGNRIMAHGTSGPPRAGYLNMISGERTVFLPYPVQPSTWSALTRVSRAPGSVR